MPRPRRLPSDRGNARLKFLDRYVGIPVVAALGAWRRLRGRRAVPTDWRSIGLLKTAGIGDTVLLSGVINDVRAARPDARIVLFVGGTNAGFARLLRGYDELVVLPVRRPDRAIALLRARRLDILVDFGAWPRLDALFSALSGARATVGLRTPGQHRHFAHDVVIDHGSDHEVRNYRRLVRAVGVESSSPPAITAPDPMSAPARRADDYVVFHLWPGGANFDERSWPTVHWADLARAINASGYEVVLTGGPTDVASVDALVDARWGPLGPYTRCVASPMVPDGYLNLGFEQNRRYARCMEEITVAAVLEAFRDVVAQRLGDSGRGGESRA